MKTNLIDLSRHAKKIKTTKPSSTKRTLLDMHQKNFYKEKRHAQEVLLSTIYERIMVTKGVVASVSDRGWQDHASIMRGKVLDGLNEAMDSLEELMTLTESSGGSPQDTTV